MRVFNFAAGPATLPLEVLEQAQAELTDWRGSGMSVMEVSHRGKAFRLLHGPPSKSDGYVRSPGLHAGNPAVIPQLADNSAHAP